MTNMGASLWASQSYFIHLHGSECFLFCEKLDEDQHVPYMSLIFVVLPLCLWSQCQWASPRRICGYCSYSVCSTDSGNPAFLYPSFSLFFLFLSSSVCFEEAQTQSCRWCLYLQSHWKKITPIPTETSSSVPIKHIKCQRWMSVDISRDESSSGRWWDWYTWLEAIQKRPCSLQEKNIRT